MLACRATVSSRRTCWGPGWARCWGLPPAPGSQRTPFRPRYPMFDGHRHLQKFSLKSGRIILKFIPFFLDGSTILGCISRALCWSFSSNKSSGRRNTLKVTVGLSWASNLMLVICATCCGFKHRLPFLSWERLNAGWKLITVLIFPFPLTNRNRDIPCESCLRGCQFWHRAGSARQTPHLFHPSLVSQTIPWRIAPHWAALSKKYKS